jgi:hypothetical protein
VSDIRQARRFPGQNPAQCDQRAADDPRQAVQAVDPRPDAARSFVSAAETAWQRVFRRWLRSEVMEWLNTRPAAELNGLDAKERRRTALGQTVDYKYKYTAGGLRIDSASSTIIMIRMVNMNRIGGTS